MPAMSSLRWPGANLARSPRNLNMSLAPSKKCVWPSFQVTMATQLGYFETNMPQTGQRSLAPGLGRDWAAASGTQAASNRDTKRRRFTSTFLHFSGALAALLTVLADHRNVAGHVQIGFAQRIVEVAKRTTMLGLEFLGSAQRSERMLRALGHRMLQIGANQIHHVVDRRQRARFGG